MPDTPDYTKVYRAFLGFLRFRWYRIGAEQSARAVDFSGGNDLEIGGGRQPDMDRTAMTQLHFYARIGR